MRDLDRALVGGHEPAVRQGGERGRRVLVAAELELVERHAAAHERALLLAGVRQPQQDAPRGGSLLALTAARRWPRPAGPRRPRTPPVRS